GIGRWERIVHDLRNDKGRLATGRAGGLEWKRGHAQGRTNRWRVVAEAGDCGNPVGVTAHSHANKHGVGQRGSQGTQLSPGAAVKTGKTRERVAHALQSQPAVRRVDWEVAG